ncbi:MAG: Rid family hydrolase [Steroidobacteraceae bacterium]
MHSIRIVLALTLLAGATAAYAQAPTGVEFLNSGKVVGPGMPLSEGVRVGDTLYLSGVVGLVPGETKVVPGGLVPEARQTLKNIQTMLEAQGLSLKNVVKCTVMLADIAEWGAFNQVYKEFFSAPYPARAAFGANGLALGARVEVECIAAWPR